MSVNPLIASLEDTIFNNEVANFFIVNLVVVTQRIISTSCVSYLKGAVAKGKPADFSFFATRCNVTPRSKGNSFKSDITYFLSEIITIISVCSSFIQNIIIDRSPRLSIDMAGGHVYASNKNDTVRLECDVAHIADIIWRCSPCALIFMYCERTYIIEFLIVLRTTIKAAHTILGIAARVLRCATKLQFGICAGRKLNGRAIDRAVLAVKKVLYIIRRNAPPDIPIFSWIGRFRQRYIRQHHKRHYKRQQGRKCLLHLFSPLNFDMI